MLSNTADSLLLSGSQRSSTKKLTEGLILIQKEKEFIDPLPTSREFPASWQLPDIGSFVATGEYRSEQPQVSVDSVE